MHSISVLFISLVPEAFDRQIVADMAQGYDYVGYHNYAKRRYSELVGGESPLIFLSFISILFVQLFFFVRFFFFVSFLVMCFGFLCDMDLVLVL
jgi:hypothetical protein